MKNMFGIALLFVLITGCASYLSGVGNYFTYSFAPVEPLSPNMDFADSNISLKFDILPTSVAFVLHNLTDKPIKIIWDDASIVQGGEAKKIMHTGVKYIDRSQHQPPTTIPSKTYIDDGLTPIDKVWYSSYTGWQTSPLFIDDDMGKPQFRAAALSYKGETLGVLLPVEIDGHVTNYQFEFLIADVQEIPKTKSR
jgi:hypothetical protein